MPPMRYLLGRRLGPWGVALTAWDVWRRLPPQTRRRLLDQMRQHGPRIARQAAESRRRRPR